MPPTTLFGLGYGTGPAGYGYPPGARRPSISYPDSPFTWYDHVEITASSPTNGGGPITGYVVLSGTLPDGVSLNATTGELTGTPTAQQSAASVVIRARGPGGVSDTTISVEVLAMPLSLGTSLAAWYRADAGCYTDAACLFASASSQYLSKTSPTFAPTTKMTIAFDYKPTTIAFGALCGIWGAGGKKFVVFIGAGGEVIVYFADGEAQTSDLTMSAGVNSRIVIVYDGTLVAADRLAIYVNGVAATITHGGTVPTTLTASTEPLSVGENAATYYANGALARLGFSSLALSGAALTAAHTSTFWADMTAARQADWFSFYNLCEASSTRVDSTGLNNLTPTNGPTVAAGPGEGACVNNAPRKRIEDASGNARHRTQATIAAQPLWLTAIQNAMPVGRFDGTDDYDRVLSDFGAQPITVLSALKHANTDNICIWDGADAAARCAIFHGVVTPGQQEGHAGSTIGAAHTAGAFHVYEATYNGASSEVVVDGVQLATGNAGAQGLGVGFTVGATYFPSIFASADEGETIVVVGAMTAAQKASARAYLKQRWGTP